MKKALKAITAVMLIILTASAFSGCTRSTDEDLDYEIVNNEAVITGYTDSTVRTEVTVPDEIDGYPVTKIEDFGLFNAESLTKITIGKNVKEIGTWSMTNNQRLQEFVVDEENQYFTAVDGILFSKDMKTLIYYPNAKNIEFNKYGEAQNTTQYVIPDGVEVIRSKAFYKCYYLDDIQIPDSVKRVEEKGFHRCSALLSIDLPDNLEFIGKDAFAYCELIESVTIPASIKQIDEYAFFNCYGMKKLDIYSTEDKVTLGENWYPTQNGQQIDECELNWLG